MTDIYAFGVDWAIPAPLREKLNTVVSEWITANGVPTNNAAVKSVVGKTGDITAEDLIAAGVGGAPEWSKITGKPDTFPTSPAKWADITDKPTSFPPTTHTHTMGDITGLNSQILPTAEHTLDTYQSTGNYYQANSNWGGAERGYPAGEAQGFLFVRTGAWSMTHQVFAPWNPASGAPVRYERTRSGSTWRPWRAIGGAATELSGALMDSLNAQFAKSRDIVAADYGAKGDGVADDTAALQAAITAGAGRTVIIPAGTYKTSPLNITASNTRIVMDAGARLVVTGSASCFQVTGSIGPEVALKAATSIGDNALSTVSAHGLAVGDWILLKSQRDAMSSDAGDDWRLGNGASGNTCYFGEWHQVAEVPTTTTLTLRGAIMFPGYRPNKTQETSAYARASATIQKINPVDGVKISGGTVQCAGGSVVSAYWAKDCKVDTVRHECPSNGFTVSWNHSYGCEARGCTTVYPTSAAASLTSRSSYKAISSQECGFVDCTSTNASQAFDFTYHNKETCTTHGYVRGCRTFNPASNPVTSHAGTYAIQVSDNIFHAVNSGISIRSRSSLITGNTVEGTQQPGSMGIYLYEGWARDCLVSGNIVTGFEEGITVKDTENLEERFGWIGCNISANVVSKVKTGINVGRWAYVYTAETGAVVADNVINLLPTATDAHAGVMVGNFVTGALISHNRIQGSGSSNGIYIRTNAANTTLSGNYIAGTMYGVKSDGKTHAQALAPDIYELAKNRLVITPTGNQWNLAGGAALK